MKHTKNSKQVINQMVLDRLGEGDEFITEVMMESKPSRIDSRRQRSQEHERKKTKDRRYFEDYQD